MTTHPSGKPSLFEKLPIPYPLTTENSMCFGFILDNQTDQSVFWYRWFQIFFLLTELNLLLEKPTFFN